jgi:hypothetical protein
VPWGEFSLAAVCRKGKVDGLKVQIGWGANCRKHHVYDANGDIISGTPCQKQLTFAPGSPPEVVDENRRLAKVWLLLGRDISKDACNGRNEHLHELGGRKFRATAPDWSEDLCDRMVLGKD